MICHENGVFCISGENYSYLLRINQWGLPEQLHFGGPVSTQDAAAFALQPGLGWGTVVLLEKGNSASCPDNMALEWSGSGRGDYRESPMTLAGCAADLRYEGFRILEGTAPMGLPQGKGGSQTLELTLTQPGLQLKLYYTAYPTAITRRAVVENRAAVPVTLTKIMSFCVDLPGDLEMTSFHGGWIREMRKETVPVTQSRTVIDSTTGFSSHRHNPGFLLSEKGATEDAGRVYGFNLIYSGNHYASVQCSAQGLNRVMQGICPDNFVRELAPGERFETPAAVLAVSDGGFGGLSRGMHRFVNGHIVPEKWQNRSRPVVYNSWEGCLFQFDHSKLLSLAKRAKALGCETFVLDDGWFGKRNSENCSLGDYEVNKKKLPYGLKGLGKAIEKLGMGFGLWVEPESVSPDSDLYRSHPDWALTDCFAPLESRNQLLLDLTKPQVRDYIVEQVGRTLDSAPISYVKWDMNRHSVALGSRAHDYILGLYEVLGRIFGPRPQILLESCASGGNRFDLGMLCFSPQIWCSDDTDPVERYTIQTNLSYLYPQSTFGAHISAAPHAQTLRNTSLYTRANASFFGCFGLEMDLKHLLPVEKKQLKALIAFYKENRKRFQFGDFRRIAGGWQVSTPEKAIIGLFWRQQPAAPGYDRLQLKGLQEKRRYRLEAAPQSLRLGQFGSLIKYISPVGVDPNGWLLRFADRHYSLPDCEFSVTASGGALMSGVPLPPKFRGTGYDKHQRNQGDFGSSLYILTREE